jgi:hypothetical protein
MGLPGSELSDSRLAAMRDTPSTYRKHFVACYGKRTLAIGSPFNPLEIFVRMSFTVTV